MIADGSVADLCAELIRFDTTNHGAGTARGERSAADRVAARLTDWGYAPEVIESAPNRASTVVRIAGVDRTVPGVLVHGHLDVVPADAGDWSVDPFAGTIRDGWVWGRGALDMKGMLAMMLAVTRRWSRDGVVPPRDVVLAFLADEEAGGALGAGHLVQRRPDVLDGVGHAIGESGGQLVQLPDGSHLYPVAAAERGTAWIELTARGSAGHGARPGSDNAVQRLAATVARLGAIDWPLRVIPAVGALLEGIGARLGITLEPTDRDLLTQLGAAAPLVASTLSHSLTPTMLRAGETANVVPSQATAVLDGRVLPGYEDEFFTAIEAVLAPGVSLAFLSRQDGISADLASPELARMQAALAVHDPGALVLPYCARGGTDAKWFSRLGIDCFGFEPAQLPDWAGALIHGIDERVPIPSLSFGADVLDSYLSGTGDSRMVSSP